MLVLSALPLFPELFRNNPTGLSPPHKLQSNFLWWSTALTMVEVVVISGNYPAEICNWVQRSHLQLQSHMTVT